MRKQIRKVAEAIAQAPAAIVQMPARLVKKAVVPEIPPKTLVTINLKLQREEKRLQDEIAKIKKYPEYGTAEDENVQELEEFNQNVGLTKNLRTLLKETQVARAKIGKGSYGSCESCKNPIELGRLQAFPSAALCITCQKDSARKRWWQLWKRT